MAHLRYASTIEDMGQDGRMAALRQRRNGEALAQPRAADALA